MLKNAGLAIFYGNYFIALCTVALSVEAGMQQQVPLNSIAFYLLLFSGTVVYYTYAYIGATISDRTYNERSAWYKSNKKFILTSQKFFIALSILLAAYLLIKNISGLRSLLPRQWVLIVIFPVTAYLYYGIVLSPHLKIRLRSPGWLKPFVIGFVWAGVVTIYPILFKQIESATYHHHLSFFGGWLFIKNWMFISVLAIMFDIKDYAADQNQQLKTFVVRIGLRKTIFFIIIPLSMAGLLAYIFFAWSNHFLLQNILINCIPFLLLILVAYSMHLRKPIIYYLAVIDGLMLVKAVCGILGIVLIQ